MRQKYKRDLDFPGEIEGKPAKSFMAGLSGLKTCVATVHIPNFMGKTPKDIGEIKKLATGIMNEI